MKKTLLFSLISFACLLCISCKKNNLRPGDGIPVARILMVKFQNPGQLDKVIVQHPFKGYNGTEGYYEYDENTGLYLNVIPERYTNEHEYGLEQSITDWIEQEMHLAGTTPYIPLSDGYYMIDWKWNQIMPLSALSSTLDNAYHNPFEEHIQKHCFLTDINWTDLKDLSAGYDITKYTQHANNIETIRVRFRAIDQLYNDVKQGDPYVCWNMSLYSEGLSVKNAYMYYKYGDCDSTSGKTYRTYIDYCDSLQAVYQQRLIELINKGQHKTLEAL